MSTSGKPDLTFDGLWTSAWPVFGEVGVQDVRLDEDLLAWVLSLILLKRNKGDKYLVEWVKKKNVDRTFERSVLEPVSSLAIYYSDKSYLTRPDKPYNGANEINPLPDLKKLSIRMFAGEEFAFFAFGRTNEEPQSLCIGGDARFLREHKSLAASMRAPFRRSIRLHLVESVLDGDIDSYLESLPWPELLQHVEVSFPSVEQSKAIAPEDALSRNPRREQRIRWIAKLCAYLEKRRQSPILVEVSAAWIIRKMIAVSDIRGLRLPELADNGWSSIGKFLIKDGIIESEALTFAGNHEALAGISGTRPAHLGALHPRGTVWVTFRHVEHRQGCPACGFIYAQSLPLEKRGYVDDERALTWNYRKKPVALRKYIAGGV